MKLSGLRWLGLAVLGVTLQGQQTPTLTREYIYLGDRVVAVENTAGSGGTLVLEVNCDSESVLAAEEQRQCVATLNGQRTTDVDWTVAVGAGTVGLSTGLYTAPVVPAGQASTTATVKATLKSNTTKTATADVVVVPVLWPRSQSVPSGPMEGLSIRVTRSGAWTATSNQPAMLEVVSGGSGSGEGVVIYRVLQNPLTTQRTGTLMVAGAPFVVTQSAPGAAAMLNPIQAGVPGSGGSGTISVGMTGNWSVINPNTGMVTTNVTGGTGNGSVNYTVSGNPLDTDRSGSLLIGGTLFRIDQARCSIGLNPASGVHGGGQANYAVQVATTCATWAVSSDSPWLTVLSAGAGTVTYKVEANTGQLARTGHLTIGGLQYTVVQERGAYYELTPTVVTLNQGNSRQFNLYQVSGNTWIPVNGSATWSVSPAGFGVISNGLYTAPTYVATGQSAQVTATIGGQTLTATVNFQFLSLPGSATISPSAGSGLTQQFNVYLSYTGTYELSNNPNRHILFNTVNTSTVNSCYAVWYVIGTNGSLWLGNDQGTGFVSGPSLMPLDPTAPASAGPENGQCSLDINGSNQRYEGTNYLRLMMMTTFKPAFAGTKNDYYRTGNEATWLTLGTWTVPAAVSAPTFTPTAGTYGAGQTVTMQTATSGATIRYTTDGTAPTATTGTVYTAPLVVTATTTLRAIGYKSGMTPSTVVSATYAVAGLQADLVVTTVPAGSTTFKATNSITAGAGVTVNSGAKAAFEAGNYIRLLPGFQTTAGGTGDTFRAKINPQVQ